MKKQFLLISALVCALTLTFTACANNDDDIRFSDVPDSVQSSFQNLYAETSVKWEVENGLYKAELWVKGKEVDVYFKPDGTWVRTDSDFSPMGLPTAVVSYVETNYPDYRIDDADYVETPTGNYYEIELEKNGTRDVYLKITEEGALAE